MNTMNTMNTMISHRLPEFKETSARILFMGAACVCILAVVLICLFLLVNGVPAIAEIGLFEFLSGTTWRPASSQYGIAPMIVGSLYVTAGALIIGIPFGLLTAIYMARFASPRVLRIMRPAMELLAGIPSVVYGFFGLMLIIPLIRLFSEKVLGAGVPGMSILAASLLLGIMVLPTIITVSYASLKAVPESYYEGGLALGANHERCVFKLVVPAAGSGIMAGIILGMGRAVGETMAVIMVIGNQPRMPTGLLEGARTLTGNIVLEMGYAADLHRGALIGTAVVLFVFILLINVLFYLLSRKVRS
ncbi:MAG: phosphate ABC transporter permease subunit PstC [Coriobacteriales bacterium]|jgi:phosphate transport system permease protein|nr:phosphate ABC transporter permease subunit PstC [Coriobacteriales bacterium]